MGRFRELRGPALLVWKGLLLFIPITGMLYIFGLHIYLGLPIFTEQYVGLFLGLVLAGNLIGVPASPRAPRGHVPWYDWLLASLGLAVGLYVAILYPQVTTYFARVTVDRVIFGTLAIVLILETLRRLTGWVLVVIVLAFISYAFLASYLPGALRARTIDLANLANYLYLDSSSLLRMLALGATLALAFMLYSQVLLVFGGSEILNNLAAAAFGRFRGAEPKMAVVGSSLVGTVTGGAANNVLLTGIVTIPLMIRAGYPRAFAGAVEAIASTGGQIMPPVMGIAAFVMADFLSVPYSAVAKAAVIPALLYYLCIFLQVDLLAGRQGRRGLPSSQLPSLRATLRNGWVILPALGILVYLLFGLGYDASTTGVLSAGLAVPLFLLRREGRGRFLQRIAEVFLGTARLLLEVSVVLAAAGLIVGVTGATGLGFNIGLALTQIGGHNLFLLLVVSAIACLILGMGMPSVPAYALVAVMVAPAMQELGVLPMAAHMFIFYFAILSNITPPVALAAYVAAPLAGASANRIGFTAMHLGIVAYIIPFLFVYSPTLIMVGNPISIMLSVVTVIIGTGLLAAAMIGFLVKPMTHLRRGLLGAGALGLMFPFQHYTATEWAVNITGAALAALISLLEWRECTVRSAVRQARSETGR